MNKTILVVEDYDDIRSMMRILLEVHGYKVFEASDGYEAVQMARQHRPDMILLDLAMPVMDGLEAAREIRSHDYLANTPIVAVTAYGDLYRDQALSAGCNEVVAKPLDFESLGPLVEKYIGGLETI
ncbi:MAG: response regulator [Pyrinomonadaceae bacterium]